MTFADVLRSEWIKFHTTRSTVVLTAVLALALPALAVLVAATESLNADDTVLGASVLGGAVLAQLLAAVLGTMTMTAEHRSGQIHSTFCSTPRRSLVLAAKATVAATVVAVVTLPSAVVAFALGGALLDDTYATGDPFPALVGVALALAVAAALGVAIGAVVRHASGAVAAVVGLVLAPSFIAPLLGDLQRWLGGAALDGVLQKLTQSSDATPATVGSLGAWPSLAALGAIAAAVLAGAGVVLRRRDA